MRDLLQLSDNKILLLLFITAMFICVCSNILLVYSILEGEKKMKKICSIFGSFLLLLVFGFIICMTKYLFGMARYAFVRTKASTRCLSVQKIGRCPNP